jgi:hypothetical protein
MKTTHKQTKSEKILRKDLLDQTPEVLKRKKNGRGTTYEWSRHFMQEGELPLTREQFTQAMFEDYLMIKTRNKLRSKKLIIEVEADMGLQRVSIRAAYNLQRWRDGQIVREYVLTVFLSDEELAGIVSRYFETGEVYISKAFGLQKYRSLQLEIDFNDRK